MPSIAWPAVWNVRTAEIGTTGSTVHCSQRKWYGMAVAVLYARTAARDWALLQPRRCSPHRVASCNTDTYTAGCCRRIAAAVFRLYRCAKSVVVQCPLVRTIEYPSVTQLSPSRTVLGVPFCRALVLEYLPIAAVRRRAGRYYRCSHCSEIFCGGSASCADDAALDENDAVNPPPLVAAAAAWVVLFSRPGVWVCFQAGAWPLCLFAFRPACRTCRCASARPSCSAVGSLSSKLV